MCLQMSINTNMHTDVYVPLQQYAAPVAVADSAANSNKAGICTCKYIRVRLYCTFTKICVLHIYEIKYIYTLKYV